MLVCQEGALISCGGHGECCISFGLCMAGWLLKDCVPRSARYAVRKLSYSLRSLTRLYLVGAGVAVGLKTFICGIDGT